MDGCRGSLELISTQGVKCWQNEGPSVGGQKRCVAAGDDLSMHRTGHPILPEDSEAPDRQRTASKANDLGSGVERSQADVTGSCVRSLQSGELGVRDESQTHGDPNEDGAVINGAALNSSRLCQLVNSAGLGEVLTERQLYELRKQFPAIQESRGRIRLLQFVAALCKKRRRARSSTCQLQLADLFELLEEQQYRCALTGELLTPDNVAVDHIVAISDGGDFAKENSQLVSKAANRAKNTMPQRDFVEMCIRVAQTHSSNGETP